MTPNRIILAMIAQLKSNDALNYVDDNQIFEGVRIGLIVFPCIVVESLGDRVVEDNYPYEKLVLTVKEGGFINLQDKDHQLTDDGVNKGLLTLKNDIKKAIYYDHTFGLADVYHAQCSNSQDSNIHYPVRGFEMTVDITYKQNRITRV